MTYRILEKVACLKHYWTPDGVSLSVCYGPWMAAEPYEAANSEVGGVLVFQSMKLSYQQQQLSTG